MIKTCELKIKNPSTQVNKACHQIAKSPHTTRLLLTGTPIQNNLVELWTLFDWATSGRVLGKKSDFLKKYAEPIERGRDKNSNETTLKIAEKANEVSISHCLLYRLYYLFLLTA
jgi:SNF2 family DNA or RNA helicase